ncbi:MAG TPA: hypothetical protein VJV79_37290 [Polyangiaceae bacterium]|nr:hypothetical protein [Polyangiaceae bacterium]
MSIEALSLAVPAERRARFLSRALVVAERARACQSSAVELELALRVLSVLCGAVSSGAHGSDS